MSKHPKTSAHLAEIRPLSRKAYEKLISTFDEESKQRSHSLTKRLAADALSSAPDIDPETLGLSLYIAAAVLVDMGDAYFGAGVLAARVGEVILAKIDSGDPVNPVSLMTDAVRHAEPFLDLPGLGDLLDKIDAKIKAEAAKAGAST